MVGTDVDPVALQAATRNAEANRVSSSFQVRSKLCGCWEGICAVMLGDCTTWLMLDAGRDH